MNATVTNLKTKTSEAFDQAKQAITSETAKHYATEGAKAVGLAAGIGACVGIAMVVADKTVKLLS